MVLDEQYFLRPQKISDPIVETGNVDHQIIEDKKKNNNINQDYNDIDYYHDQFFIHRTNFVDSEIRNESEDTIVALSDIEILKVPYTYIQFLIN